jgi:hypothetical protein
MFEFDVFVGAIDLRFWWCALRRNYCLGRRAAISMRSDERVDVGVRLMIGRMRMDDVDSERVVVKQT